MDIDGGGTVEVPPDREPMTGPVGDGELVLLCGVLGGVAVGLGAVLGCALPVLPVGGFAELFDAGAGESLIDPASRPEPCDEDPAGFADEGCDSGAPPGDRSSALREPEPEPAPAVDPAALFVSWPGGEPALLPQAAQQAQTAQTRAAATAVAAALAGATVPRFGMDATVAKTGRHAGGTRRRARCVRRDCSTVSARDGFSLDNR
ncbi:hypothetical protein [Catenulispora yoronensis]|uniref:hypothetical protein n=1 Tax=Catenulispora yoronensis TaxID=450799 RepID=UPI0031D5B30D